MLIIFPLLGLIYSMIMPNCGNIYNKIIYIPLIGKQKIETEFGKNSLIYIRLNGLLIENGTATYKLNNNEFDFKLSNNLKTLLNEQKSEFKFTKYNRDEDKVYIRLYVKPLFLRKNIALERKND